MQGTVARRRVIRWVSCAAVALAPALASAQVSVQYRTLTVVESAYLYSGLAMQAVLRNSGLRQLPQVIVACGVAWMLLRRVTSPQPQPIAAVVAYVVSCGVILCLFWPEAAPRFFQASMLTRVFPGAVTSYVAERNVMTVDDAGSSRLVPASLQTAGGARVPRFTDLLVQVATTVPLTLGETIDSAGLARPFERIPMLHKMMEQDVPADLTAMMPEFVRRCYMPASIWAADDPGVTFEKVVPWGSVMSTQLAKHHISTYADGTLSLKRWAQSFLPGMFTADTTDCKRFYEGLETRVSNFLRGETTQQGSTMQQRYLDVLDLTAQSQARFYVMRELEKEMGQGAEVYAPEHVTALKRKVDVASFTAGALGNFDLTAPGRSTVGEIQKFTDRLSRFLGVGSFLVYWAPYIVGFAMFALLAFFPVVVLWSLFPGQHFKPLVNYVLLLIFVCSTPLWWAMVNVGADLVHQSYAAGGNWFTAVGNWGHAQVAVVVVTVIGIVMVPVVQAVLLFGTWRAIGGIWRA